MPYWCHFLVYLSSIGTFNIWVLKGHQLQQAHPKGINVYKLIVFLLVKLRCHELRSTWNHGNNYIITSIAKACLCFHQHQKEKELKEKVILFSPMTLWADRAWRRMAASPKSPIFTSPWFPLTKMLSHFRSRWITGGSWLWR